MVHVVQWCGHQEVPLVKRCHFSTQFVLFLALGVRCVVMTYSLPFSHLCASEHVHFIVRTFIGKVCG